MTSDLSFLKARLRRNSPGALDNCGPICDMQLQRGTEKQNTHGRSQKHNPAAARMTIRDLSISTLDQRIFRLYF